MLAGRAGVSALAIVVSSTANAAIRSAARRAT
jgi:hypothetical protein